MPLIEFRTLGTIDLRTGDGLELYSLLAQPKRIAFLAYLCVAQPRGFHRRDTLLGLFWPNADQDHARGSLRKALHALRRALGDDAIVSRGDEEVAVDFNRISCDAVAFDASLKANRLEEALDIYRGELLAGFFIDDAQEFEQWLQSERARLRAAAAHAAYALSDQLGAAGDFATAVTWARRSLELADTDERSLRKLIELQCKAGDRVEAIQVYEAFARRLAADYQTEPSTDTRSLIEHIRSGKFGGEAAAKTIAGSVARPLEEIPRDRFGIPREASTRNDKSVLYPVIVLALAVLIAGAGLWSRLRPTQSQAVVRYALVVDSAETIVKGGPWSGRIALSPDGSQLAYIGGPRSQLLIRARNQLHATAVPGTDGANTPFFSPDGSQVGFLRETQVQIASMNGGLLTTVTDTLTGLAGASWGPDGFIYADGSLGTSLLRFEAKAGAVPKWFTVLDTASGEVDHTWPDVLPNGKGVLFTVEFTRRNGGRAKKSYSVAVAEIPSGKHRIIVNDAMYAHYAFPGYLLYVTTQRTLMAVPFDQSSMKVTGEPRALVNDMRLGAWGSADLAVSATGTLVYATGEGQGKYELVWVTRDGKTQPVDPDWPGGYLAFPAISPDGKRLAVARSANDESINIWVKQLDRGSSVQVTTAGQENYSPAWTPNGSSVTFSSNTVAEPFELWTKRADGSSQAVLQAHERRSLFAARWSPDGKWLIFQTDPGSPGAGDILGIRPGIDPAPLPLVVTKFTEIAPALSPDGRWLAYTSNETGKYEIYVVPFPNTGAAKWAVSTSGGTEPVWSHRGSELFYRDAFANLVAAEVKTKPTFSLGRSTVLFPAAGFTSSRFIAQYAVASDDRRFLMIRSVASGTPDKLIVVENWYEELNPKLRK